MAKKHLVIPDTQDAPDRPKDHLDWCGQYIVHKQPDVIVHVGDGPTLDSLSTYEPKGSKKFENRRYQAEIKSFREAMSRLLGPLREYQKWTRLSHKPRYEPRLVYTRGNHDFRIERAINADPHTLEGTIGYEDLGLEEAGWEVYPFLQPIVVDGIAYCHYFPTGKMGKPAPSARALIANHHMSCFAGHAQGRDIAYGKRIDGKKITAIISGSFYLHDEDYLPPPSNQHWRGVWMLHEVNDGQFDEMPVSIDYLRRKYGS